MILLAAEIVRRGLASLRLMVSFAGDGFLGAMIAQQSRRARTLVGPSSIGRASEQYRRMGWSLSNGQRNEKPGIGGILYVLKSGWSGLV